MEDNYLSPFPLIEIKIETPDETFSQESNYDDGENSNDTIVKEEEVWSGNVKCTKEEILDKIKKEVSNESDGEETSQGQELDNNFGVISAMKAGKKRSHVGDVCVGNHVNLRKQLLETLYDEDNFGGEASGSEEDEVVDYSDTQEEDGVEKHDSDAGQDDELDNEMEDAPPTKRMCHREEQEELNKTPLRGRPPSKLYGKLIRDGERLVWSTNPSTRQSDRNNHKLPDYTPGPIGDAANCENVFQFWSVLFTDEIISIIVQCTNVTIENRCADLIANRTRIETYHHHTNATEIYALVAILYHLGMWKTHRMNAEKLWSYGNGVSFYRCVMPYKRFIFLTSCLHFDIKATRNPDDEFAPIRKIWDIFIGNCAKNYNPNDMCTVGELHGFRERCSRAHMKPKPEYGMMYKTLNDAKTAYLIFAIPYLGKAHGLSAGAVLEYFFHQVTEPIHGTHRTVTIDNRFTTIPLLLKMLEEPYNLTITGTLQKNTREIPDEMKVTSNIPGSKFCHTDKITVVSYTSKKQEIVLVASTFMVSNEVTNGKPNLIVHYNETKGGTDTFEQLCHSFTTARRTKRWALRDFFGILDQAAVNARILYTCKQINENKPAKLTAQNSLHELIQNLAKPMLQQRLTNFQIRKDIFFAIRSMLAVEPIQETVENLIILKKGSRCSLCKRSDDKKTRLACYSCRRPMCHKHRAFICINCAGQG